MTQYGDDYSEILDLAGQLMPGYRGAKLLGFREIAERTHVTPRNLRYVLDHELLGSGAFTVDDKPATGHGVAREFSVFSAFTLSLAGLMLEAGLRSELVRLAIQSIFGWANSNAPYRHGPGYAPFLVFFWAKGVSAEIADGANVRILVDPTKLTEPARFCPKPLDWRDITTATPVAGDYAPLVTVRLDLGVLHKALS